MTHDCDLLIVGGGPAGLSAAINGASEGLRVCLLDAGRALGGQAKESASIENYPMPLGFDNGVTGHDLMTGFIAQATKFNTQMFCPVNAIDLEKDGNRRIVTTDDYDEYAARAVILSLGLRYRTLQADGIGALMGRGVYYGIPGSTIPYRGKCVGIVGGANSAGQAALNLAKSKTTKVKMFVRKTLAAQMSQYLIDRIKETPNVEVYENTEVNACEGRDKLQAITLKDGTTITVVALFIYIGAVPKTAWLRSALELTPQRFVCTRAREGHLPFETSCPGVFAAGDVRDQSTKRIAAAIGEGSAALQSCHKYLG